MNKYIIIKMIINMLVILIDLKKLQMTKRKLAIYYTGAALLLLLS